MAWFSVDVLVMCWLVMVKDQRFVGDVLAMRWWYVDDSLARSCSDDVVAMCLWCIGDILVIRDMLVIFWWCVGDLLTILGIMCCWEFGHVMVMFCAALVIYRWCFSDIGDGIAMFWWCSGNVLVIICDACREPAASNSPKRVSGCGPQAAQSSPRSGDQSADEVTGYPISRLSTKKYRTSIEK